MCIDDIFVGKFKFWWGVGVVYWLFVKVVIVGFDLKFEFDVEEVVVVVDEYV